jgi:endogenous inhibitor of DNA gyrase (YacG/DUF329 family)
MKCLQCNKELEIIAGKESKKFCSDKCRKAFGRATSDRISVPTSDKPTSDTLKIATSDNIGQDKVDLSKLSASELYNQISLYPQDTWKNSPEFQELNKHLGKKTLKELTDGGYWIPSRLFGVKI